MIPFDPPSDGQITKLLTDVGAALRKSRRIPRVHLQEVLEIEMNNLTEEVARTICRSIEKRSWVTRRVRVDRSFEPSQIREVIGWRGDVEAKALPGIPLGTEDEVEVVFFNSLYLLGGGDNLPREYALRGLRFADFHSHRRGEYCRARLCR